MNLDAKDRILEACLEEVLGGQKPPDVTARVMQALDGQTAASSGNGAVQASAVAVPSIGENSTAVRVAPKQPLAKRRVRNRWLNVALAASILAAVVSVGTLTFQLVDRSQNNGQSVAKPNSSDAEKNAADRLAKQNTVAPPIKDGTLVNRRGMENGAKSILEPEKRPKNEADSIRTQVATDARRTSDSEVVALINSKLLAGWKKFGVVPVERASDETWCRRLFDVLLGREPTGSELESFVADVSKDKREMLVARLFEDPTCSDQLAGHVASVWTDLLIGPAGGRRQGDLASRPGLRRYLRDSFASNKPLDALARELISATGTGKPGSNNFNGASNFLLAHMDRKGSTATAHVGRVFLGQRVKCAQCHSHSDGVRQLAQSDFWQLNAFFRQVDFERRSNAGEYALVDRDFDGEGDDPNDAEVYFETADGRLQVAYPVLNGKAIPTSGYVEDVNRRQELAKLITESSQFERTLVNHFWKSFFVYELPSSREKDDELVDVLASELRNSEFDSKRLMRWIVLSDAFSLTSEAPTSIEIDSPEFGGMALFSRFYQRTVEVVPVTMGLAAAAKAFSDGSVNARRTWYGSFGPQTSSADSIIAPELVAPAPELSVIGLDDRELIRKLSVAQDLGFNEKVGHLFWATVTRNPTNRELKLAKEIYGANSNDSFAALEAIWLVLTNSDEFTSE